MCRLVGEGSPVAGRGWASGSGSRDGEAGRGGRLVRNGLGIYFRFFLFF
jgi:hypothetical protein